MTGAGRTSIRSRAAANRAPLVGLAVAVLLIVAGIAVPAITGWQVHVKSFPPLHARWDPRLGPGTIPAIAVAALTIAFGMRVAARWPWGRMLLATFLTAVAWMTSLATVDGLAGIGHILDTGYEYLQTARSVTDFSATLHEYIARIPLDSPHNWPVHIAGHPPGALLFFFALVHVGLGSGPAAGSVVLVLAATTPIAVLVTLRRLGAETQARWAAPLLATGPAAIWMAVSADAMFGAVAAWGLCALAGAATARSLRAAVGLAVVAGLLLGYCVMLSYGLPILGILALAVLLVARGWQRLPWVVGAAIVAAVSVVLAFAVWGFSWWSAYPVLVQRYWDGVATKRPFGYWVWADLAALVFSAGPLVGASVAAALARLRGMRSTAGGERVVLRGERVVVALTVAALATVLVADLSGMSKAEVERIWLPFVPWLLVSTALLPPHWRRFGLAGQLCFALLLQHLLFTGW
jgi:hypothetical protein